MSDGNLKVTWTAKADEQVAQLKPEDFSGQDPRKWAEDMVKQFQQEQPELEYATKATIRKVAHTGGTDPNEPEHFTVSFKEGNKNLDSPHSGAWHIYTSR